MASVNGERDPVPSRPLSALPSVQARVLAFGAILVAGICGGLIGFSAVRVGCQGKCSTPEGIGGITGAVFATIGVSVIAVLVLRAMGEWRSIKDTRQLEMMIAAASAFAEEEAARHVVVPAPSSDPLAPSPASDVPPPVAEPPPDGLPPPDQPPDDVAGGGLEGA